MAVTPERADAERRVLALLAAEDGTFDDPDEAVFRRGVTARYLHEFTTSFQCWDWPTWRVVRDIVRPATVTRRSRYFEIVANDHPDECGAPHAFISHSWAAKWGALVGAATYGSLDGSRRVWVDVFAVRQWPGSPNDLNFRAVVNRCNSLIVALSHEAVEETNLNDLDLLTSRADSSIVALFESSLRQKIPFARSWCLAELGMAHVAQRPVIVLSGESLTDAAGAKKRFLKLPRTARTGESSWTPDRPFGVSSFGLVEVLSELVSLEDAETTLESDRQRIHTEIEESIGFDAFNAAIRSALLGASIDPVEAEAVLPLLCEMDDRALRRRALTTREPARLLATVAGYGLTPVLATLIDEYGYDFEDCSMPALWAASGRGRLNVVEQLVDHYHASVEVRAGNAMTPLAAAAAERHEDVVRFLLSRGAAVDARARLGRTALINAAINGHDRILPILSRAGSDAQLIDDEGYSALAHAVTGRHVDAVRTLILHCAANVNIQSGPANFSPLHWAARHTFHDVADILLTLGAQVDTPAEDGTTPLITAAVNGDNKMVELLIRRGADVGASNHSGWGVLAVAVDSGNPFLLEAIAKAVPESAYGDLRRPVVKNRLTPLDLAIDKLDMTLIKILVEQLDWDINTSPDGTQPPLISATAVVRDDQPESSAALTYLLARGADLDVRGQEGASVLFACRSARALDLLTADESARTTLCGIVNERLSNGWSALHAAAALNHAEVVRGLVSQLGAQVDLPGPQGATPWAIAVQRNAADAARVLWEYGATQ